ncbi:MAG: hypothetical protein NTZ17_20300 [Phycisphaerae bacterium]|nr:hypothetical protein [Phycisphaerae bacterium]
MKRRASVFGLIMVTILWAAVPAGATFSEFAIGAKVGTLGLGGEVTTDLVPRVNLRGSLQWLDFNYETEIEGVNYNLDLSFLHPLVMADWYVFGGSFRLSGGVLFDGTHICLDATSTEPVEIGGHEYQPNELGRLRGEAEFNPIAPYIGVGFGNALSRKHRWGFTMDLGVAFIGSPDVTLSAIGAPLTAQLQADLAQEERDLEDDLHKFQFYPVLALTLFFRF